MNFVLGDFLELLLLGALLWVVRQKYFFPIFRNITRVLLCDDMDPLYDIHACFQACFTTLLVVGRTASVGGDTSLVG